MQSAYTILPCNKEQVKTIIDGINNYNLSHVPAIAAVWTPLDFIITDENDTVIAGVLGGIGYWNGLEIRILWVDEAHRSKGLGSQLLKHTEEAAANKGATISMLDTFDFQAEVFYLKNGYTPVGEINDFPNGHRRIYLSKVLHK